MLGGGENNIPKGAVTGADVDVCDPKTQSCVDPSFLLPEPSQLADAPECVPQSDEFAVSDMDALSEAPLLTGGQAAFYKDAPKVPVHDDVVVPPYDYELRSSEILDDIFVELENPEITYSAIEALVEGPPVGLFGYTPPITADSKSESYDVFGAGVDGHEYTMMYQDGMGGLKSLGEYLMLPPDKIVSADIEKAWGGLEMYAAGEHGVYGEGISYGWTVSHALEFYTNCVYEVGRSFAGGTDIDFVELSGFNFGLNMTDLNKRDPSGKLGDIIRNEMRRLANREFGGKVWDGGYSGNGIRSADNIAALKNTTILVMGGPLYGQGSDLTGTKAEEGLKNIQEGLQNYIGADEFKRELTKAHGEKAADINLEGMRIGLAGQYGEIAIDPLDVAKGKLETRVVEFLGQLHHGESVISKGHWSLPGSKPYYVQKEYLDRTKGARAATHELYGLYKSPSPGQAKEWVPGKALRGALEIPLEDLEKGEVLRPHHDFGIGLRHVKEIEARLAALESAVSEYRSLKRNDPLKLDAAFEKVCKLRKELLEYIKHPPAEIDPSRVGVVERYANDFARSRKVYRFRTEGGEDLVVYKPDHVQEVIVGEKAGGKGKQWLIGMELGKVGDYMKKYAPHDGIKDPVFAQIFDFVTGGLRERGFEVEMCVLGGDEFLVHVKEGQGEKKGDAELKSALSEVIGRFESAHKGRPFPYSEKVPLLGGGKWNSIQFAVGPAGATDIYFKKPADMPEAEFDAKLKETLADEKFRAALDQEFMVFPSSIDRKKYAVVSEEAFQKLGEVSRKAVWCLEGSENELYHYDKHSPEGTYRPERTLTMEASVARMESPRDFPILVNEILPAGVQQNKKSGESIAMMPKLTFAQKKRARIEWRLGANAGAFAFASMGSKVIFNVFSGNDILEGVDAVDTFKTWGSMTAGAAGTEALYRVGAAAVTGQLFTRTAAGKLRLNTKALRGPIVGRGAKVMGGLASLGALVVADMVEHGRPDPARLANQGALMASAHYLTKAARFAGPVRKATNIHPIKMLAEFLIMQTLGAVEAEAVESYHRMEKRERVAAAMAGIDEAIADMQVAKKGGSEADFLEAAKRHAEARDELAEAFGDLMALEKYTNTDEFEIIDEINDDLEGMEDDLVRIEDMEGHPDDMPDWQKTSYMSPVSGSAGVHSMRFPKSMVKDIRRQRRDSYAGKKEESWSSAETAEKAFLKNTSDLKGKVSAESIRIPFEFEKEPFVEARAYEYQPAGPIPMEAEELEYGPDENSMSAKDVATRDWKERYYDLLSEDTHELQLQYMLFIKERGRYLEWLIDSD
jgi:hypothetical protein